MSKQELKPIDQLPEALNELAQISADYTGKLSQGMEALQLAGEQMAAISLIKKALTPFAPHIADELQGVDYGFAIDRANAKQGNKRYDADELMPALIDAVLKGASPIGNEFTVVHGKCYLNKNYWRRKCEQAGATGIVITVGKYEAAGREARLDARAEFYFEGKRQTRKWLKGQGVNEVDQRLTIQYDASLGLRGIEGKAEARAYKLIFLELAGGAFASFADEGDAVVDVESKPTAEADQQPKPEDEKPTAEKPPADDPTEQAQLLEEYTGELQRAGDLDKLNEVAASIDSSPCNVPTKAALRNVYNGCKATLTKKAKKK